MKNAVRCLSAAWHSSFENQDFRVGAGSARPLGQVLKCKILSCGRANPAPTGILRVLHSLLLHFLFYAFFTFFVKVENCAYLCF